MLTTKTGKTEEITNREREKEKQEYQKRFKKITQYKLREALWKALTGKAAGHDIITAPKNIGITTKNIQQYILKRNHSLGIKNRYNIPAV